MIETWLIMFQNLKISQRLYCGYLIFCIKNRYSEILTLMQQLIPVIGAEEENVIKQRPMSLRQIFLRCVSSWSAQKKSHGCVLCCQ